MKVSFESLNSSVQDALNGSRASSGFRGMLAAELTRITGFKKVYGMCGVSYSLMRSSQKVMKNGCLVLRDAVANQVALAIVVGNILDRAKE